MADREKRNLSNEKATKVSRTQAFEANIVAERNAAQYEAGSSSASADKRKNFFVNVIRRKQSYEF
jgi:hypothetical protein